MKLLVLSLLAFAQTAYGQDCSLCGEGNAMTKPDNKLPQAFGDDSDTDRSLRALQEDEDMDLPTTCGGFVEYFQTLELIGVCAYAGPLIAEGFVDAGFNLQLYCGCENAAASNNVCSLGCDIKEDATIEVEDGEDPWPCSMGAELLAALTNETFCPGGDEGTDLEEKEVRDNCCDPASGSSAMPTMLGFLLASASLAIALVE